MTAGTVNSDTAFFDCIYLQDETGGIDIFPYAESGLEIGTYVEVTGYLARYQGDLELKVISSEILDDENLQIQDPTLLSCEDASDYETNGGLLIQVVGSVKEGSVCYNSDGTVAQFIVEDETGETKIFIDGYVLSGTTGENSLSNYITDGAAVSAVGVLYMHPEVLVDESDETYGTEVAVLRVRDCDEIITISDSTYQLGSDATASVISSGRVSQLSSIAVDGTAFEAGSSDYTLNSSSDGGTIVTFPSDYLETLTAGSFTVALTFTANESSYTVENVLTVASAASGNNDDSNDDDNTGDGDSGDTGNTGDTGDTGDSSDTGSDDNDGGSTAVATVTVSGGSYVIGSTSGAVISCDGAPSQLTESKDNLLCISESKKARLSAFRG
ncbi:MAG: hypothetical protein LUG54_11280 [Clostridiales bacterium]|nr:hypothetical protein [Clostridiales bacterium]